jgi:hypothetical protein
LSQPNAFSFFGIVGLIQLELEVKENDDSKKRTVRSDGRV